MKFASFTENLLTHYSSSRMLENLYHVRIAPDFLTFEFISVGPQGSVFKVIRYNEIETPGFYNLGFGDLNHHTDQLDDLVVTNNSDSQKILRTVASTLYDFTDHHPGATVLAVGSTIARTRLYRIGISTNLNAIEKDFIVMGLTNNDWELFRLDVPYQAFLVKRKC